MTNNYDDIIKLERPASKRPKMNRSDRAAQFSPFAALTGYNELIAKTEDEQIYIDTEITEFLDD